MVLVVVAECNDFGYLDIRNGDTRKDQGKDMGRLLAVFGVALTIGYLMFAWWLVGDRVLDLKTMELNEVGDFLAGAFGPLAILWLVLGFFQQGIELRQSTTALKMQAEELRSSVTQQAAMVEVSQKQLDAALAAAQYERDLSEKSCEPHIDFQFKEWLNKGGREYAVFSARNTGPRCTFLSIVFSVSDTDQLNLGFF
ncbi:hypothetical protein E4195_01280 [Pseudomonas putida]|uniref:hypothetical protein n=1 Tax=Pseudomonas putida TaxID=303 RepID=UPI001074F208|nr:hypothetical protein [Pseudomonas putida]TFW40123.1 hypothetical protein E4195_01280 [Pseudomonas putida]